MSLYDQSMVLGSCVFGPNVSPPLSQPGFGAWGSTLPTAKSTSDIKATAYELAAKDLGKDARVEHVLARAEAIYAWLIAHPKPLSDRMAVGE